MQKVISIKIRYELKNTAAVAESPQRISIHGLMDIWITQEI